MADCDVKFVTWGGSCSSSSMKAFNDWSHANPARVAHLRPQASFSAVDSERGVVGRATAADAACREGQMLSCALRVAAPARSRRYISRPLEAAGTSLHPYSMPQPHASYIIDKYSRSKNSITCDCPRATSSRRGAAMVTTKKKWSPPRQRSATVSFCFIYI